MTDAQGTSTSAVLSSLVANLILFGCFVGAFLILRLRYKRIYAPKSSFDLVPEEKKPTPLPKDPIRWIFILLTKPQSFVIQQCGLDGYFFLRYLFIFGLTFLFGMLTWIILLPINATNGNGNSGLDQLSISNIKHRKRYYAHAFMSWIYYGSVIFVIYRELFFFNSLKTAVLSSPRYAKKLSSRTVLFQSVPDTWLDEKQFFKLFNGVKRIYVARNVVKLTHKVQIRENLALKLEKATTVLLKKAMKAKLKAEKKNIQVENPEDINLWVPENKRPRHRANGMFSAKVDTITYCRERLAILDKEVKALQKTYKKNTTKNSIFVEFDDQYHAQLAFQTVVHHNPLRMGPAHTGIEPSDVHWMNMRLFWWEKIVRNAFAVAGMTALTIFWAIPVAFVGVISNINYLTEKISWLAWINDIPSWILGVITGVLPTAMLSILTTFLPIFIRVLAKVSGCVSLQEVELFTQSAYFGFLIVNNFLITALASSATATVTKIINNPSSALSILANNLPKSCNFYISYLILQGLTVAGGALLQVVGLFLYFIMGVIFDKTLRKKYARFSGLGTLAWGTTFPAFTLLACIALAFSIIAPMILLFSFVAFVLIFIAYCHNLTYVFVEGPDSRGAHYPVALMQTFVGLYLGQVCLLGLFIVGKGYGPIVIQAIGLGATIFAHVHLNRAFSRLLKVVPIDLMKPLDGFSSTPSFNGETDYRYKVLKEKFGEKDKVEEDRVRQNLEENVEFGLALVPLMADRESSQVKSNNPLIRWIRADYFLNYSHAKQLIPATYNMETVEADNRHAYDQPYISSQMPVLWIPKDPMGWSTEQIKENSSILTMSDENSGFTEKGKIFYLGKPPY